MGTSLGYTVTPAVKWGSGVGLWGEIHLGSSPKESVCGSPLHDMEGGRDSSLKKGDVVVPRIKTEDRGHGGAHMHRRIEVFLTSLSYSAPTLFLIHTNFKTAPHHVMQLFHIEPQTQAPLLNEKRAKKAASLFGSITFRN